MPVQWFPGHMAKAGRQVREKLRLCDAVFELRDARIPRSSANPLLDQLLGDKPRVIVLNKADLADPSATRAWIAALTAVGYPTLKVDAVRGAGIGSVARALHSIPPGRLPARLLRPLRVMAVGIPNVGKSSFINRLVGQRAARTGRQAGLTRGPQWIRIARDIELLDMPGILWPKFEDPETGMRLAVCGAIRDDAFSVVEAAEWLLGWFLANSAAALRRRFRLPALPRDGAELLPLIAIRRGLVMHGGRPDVEKAAVALLKEFREGRLGRYTLDAPPAWRPEESGTPGPGV
ncbi:MAG: ribosome biogenesis GTPase YlqF [Thermoanaerobacterales bacterium]|nr:ribosome biogenesis GTPase YlqF [Thermoanaerobacterales bacterium]